MVRLFLSLCLLVSLGAFAQTGSSGYRIYSSKINKEIAIPDLVQTIQADEALVFGEQHDDSIGHQLEYLIFRELAGRFNGRLTLAMEMFHRDVQYILDEYLNGWISEKNFVRESRAWDSYKTDYRAVVEYAKELKIPVLAANAPSRYTNMVTRKGLASLEVLPKGVKKTLIAPLPIDTMTGRYFERFLEAMGGHTVPGMHLFQSQNFWDATMSWSIAQEMNRNKKAPVFMLVGRFHSDYHGGLVARLRDDYGKKVKTISCFAAEDFETPDWKNYAELADFVILTRPVKKAVSEKK